MCFFGQLKFILEFVNGRDLAHLVFLNIFFPLLILLTDRFHQFSPNKQRHLTPTNHIAVFFLPTDSPLSPSWHPSSCEVKTEKPSVIVTFKASHLISNLIPLPDTFSLSLLPSPPRLFRPDPPLGQSAPRGNIMKRGIMQSDQQILPHSPMTLQCSRNSSHHHTSH